MIALEGGELLRSKMVEGRAQHWVTRGDGKLLAAERLTDLARALGISITPEGPMSIEIKDPITAERAATITGYSKSAIIRYAKTGEIPFTKKGRAYILSRSQVISWTDKHKAQGGSYAPRGRRSKTSSQPRRGANGIMMTAEIDRGVSQRLSSYLTTLIGTPLEMTRTEFVSRVVDQALKKLGA